MNQKLENTEKKFISKMPTHLFYNTNFMHIVSFTTRSLLYIYYIYADYVMLSLDATAHRNNKQALYHLQFTNLKYIQFVLLLNINPGNFTCFRIRNKVQYFHLFMYVIVILFLLFVNNCCVLFAVSHLCPLDLTCFKIILLSILQRIHSISWNFK